MIVAADVEDGCKCARERLPLLRVSDGVLTFAIRLPRSLPRSLLLDIVDDAADDDDACDVCDVCDECDAVESTDEAEFPIEPRVAVGIAKPAARVRMITKHGWSRED